MHGRQSVIPSTRGRWTDRAFGTARDSAPEPRRCSQRCIICWAEPAVGGLVQASGALLNQGDRLLAIPDPELTDDLRAVTAHRDR